IQWRNNLIKQNQRKGRSISINWPLWKSGGMHVDSQTLKAMSNKTGITPLDTHNGIETLYSAWKTQTSQITVLQGNQKKIKSNVIPFLQKENTKVQEKSTIDKVVTDIDITSLSIKVSKVLTKIISKILKVDSVNIEGATELSEYGFDSITFTQFSNEINKKFDMELTPTIFYQFSTLDDLSAYLPKEYPTLFNSKLLDNKKTIKTATNQIERKTENLQFLRRRRNLNLSSSPISGFNGNTSPEPIAIVGISGKFPKAKNLKELWKNLKDGDDCIEEIPFDRWDWREFYGNPTQEPNKTNIKWGGFIDGIAEFDPLFFNISPREAEFMDPQQRLLMMYVWKAIEDAGYSASSLSGTKTGIFIATAGSGYSGLITNSNVAIEGYSSTGMAPSIGPNRMSYFLNFHGPSEPIETACSSSLIAIHRAMEAINSGTCDMAIVGGINTILTPEAHISFNKAGMLSQDGRCKTFSDKANGYVRGEGVGMIFLKKLKNAEKDLDNIYGVIKGSSENHGGRATSLTAPNPKAQAELLKTVYSKAGISPDTISYIEAHGTGTDLGDPIEINALKSAFKELGEKIYNTELKNNYCGLGSIKTNIGHLELASGIAGVLKVILQLKNKTLVKSLHCNTINPYIDLNNSPFYIVNEKRDWMPLVDANGNKIPRRAGISSFGFGGSNAHVIIEEYDSSTRVSNIEVTTDSPGIFVLSAK
ncbi:beta-ketoacyl synthase N-terminal-like domain-containing protein, partial [Flavivirga jejuensis]|uniref:beta-ketoacyl synthase N-terminal-like domain-containing protein n=1 Tax=Flavivirga jejuensis TaxID=870487 RepID=UPI0031E9CB9B